MNLALLVPGALWALAALALPVLVHLVRRRQQPQPLDFAALAYVDHAPRPRRRLRLRDPWLLLLRCLVLAAVVLALAQPVLHGLAANRDWHLVAPGVDANALEGRDRGAWRWIAPGFPTLDALPDHDPSAVASLIRAFDAALPEGDRLHLYVPEAMAGMDAARLSLSRAVDWNVLPDTRSPSTTSPPLRVALPADADPRLAAALAAWNAGAHETERVAVQAAETPAAAVDVLLWPFETPPPQDWRSWIDAGGRVLTRAAADDVAPLRTWQGQGAVVLDTARVGRGTWARLHCPSVEVAARARAAPFRAPGAAAAETTGACVRCDLTPDCLPELLTADFPRLLRSWLAPLPERNLAATASALVPEADGLPPSPPGRALLPLLALLAAVLFVLERILASRSRPA